MKEFKSEQLDKQTIDGADMNLNALYQPSLHHRHGRGPC